MASDSSRPGTTSITSAAGMRGVRAMASESWNDDFLWQHSSSSDLHLPSTTSRHHQRHFQYRDKRLSAASSSSEYQSPRTQVPHHSQTRPHRKASSLSTSTMGSMSTQDEALPSSHTRLSRSTSSNHSQTNNQHQGKNWASLSTTSLQEEEDEPTVTLATIASRQAATPASASPRRPPTSISPSKLPSPPHQSNPGKALLSSPSSFFRTTSTSSWRSTTPSLASDTCSAVHTSESASATETDNETVEEGENQEDTTGNWEHLSLSPDGMLLASSSGDNAGHVRFGQSSTSRRKRGRGSTFSTASPRLALSSLFGTATLAGATNEQSDGTPSKRLGASFFRRSSRLKKVESPSSGTKLVSSVEEPRRAKPRSRSPTQLSGQQTPTLKHRELVTSHNKKEDKTVRARQSTNSSSMTSTSLVFASNAGNEQSQLSLGRLAVGKQASFERTPKSSNATNGSSNFSHRQSFISYDSTFSDRLRLDDAQLSPNREAVSHEVRGDSSLVQLRNTLSPPMPNQADKSTTSLISEQSSATSASAFSNESRPELARQLYMPRRKLKKVRPQTADASLARISPSIASPPSPTASPSDKSTRSPMQPSHRTLSPSFAFPPSNSPLPETFTPPRITKSPAVSIKAETGSNASETTSASSKRNVGDGHKKKKKSVIGSSLRRRVSKRSPDGVAAESSADESGYLNTRKGSLDKLVAPSVSPNGRTVDHPTMHSCFSVETWKPTFASTATLRELHRPLQSGNLIQPDDIATIRASVLSDSDVPPATGSMRGNRLLAGLSKRMSRDFKAKKPSSADPEQKRSVVFARTEQQEISLATAPAVASTNDVERRTSFIQAGSLPTNHLESANTVVVKKHKRPLSLSGLLSRSTGPIDNVRSRSSTLIGDTAQLQLARATDEAVLRRSIPLAPLSASAIGGLRRPSGFLHRSTASSGNIPTARALLETSGLHNSTASIDGRRPSLDTFSRSPPVLQHRRSFNPLWRSATATVPEERPPSSLSLLSQTSTVRPLSMLPTAVSTATITAQSLEISKDTTLRTVQKPSTKLRQRHLPSLSLTLVPGAVTSTPPKPTSAGPTFPVLSPRTMQRAHSENPYASSQSSSFRSHQYFTASSSTTGTCTPNSRNASIPNTPSGSSRKSDDSDTSINVLRRVSLSDLKIPQRISNTQAKIGQDLKRVKQFKEGVEELKRLRKVYRGLVTSDKMSSMLSFHPDSSAFATNDERAEASPSPPPIPTDTTARVDNLMARVAVDYQKWWEIADVLINLADGADEAENEDSQSKNPNRERCKSDITVGSNSPPKESRDVPLSSRKGTVVDLTSTYTSRTSSRTELPTQEEQNNTRQASNEMKQSVVSLSPPSHMHISTPVQRRAPHLSRSYSTSSLSPSNSSPATSARTANHSTSISVSEYNNGDWRSNTEEHSASLSERQLYILRGMLNPHNSHSLSFPSSRSADNSPARTPSMTSISPRSHLFTNGLVPLSPSTSRQSSSSPISTTSPSSSPFSSTLVSPMRRRASVKKGHVVIASVQTLEDEDGRLKVRAISPIPDSPPFHVSNMLPSPICSPLSESAPSHSPAMSSRPTTSRSTSGQTASSTGNATSLSLSTSKSPPSTPILRKGRLRQASRAGMLGIRDFLKTFNTTRRNAADDPNPDISLSTSEGTSQFIPLEKRGHPANAEGEDSDQSTNRTMSKEVDANKNRVKQSTPSCSQRNGSNTTSPRSNASSEEEEDWDRRSSDEEEAGRAILRSDTQATLMPFSTSGRSHTVEGERSPFLGDSARTDVAIVSSGVADVECSNPLLSRASTHHCRERTESATSKTSTGTVVVHLLEQCTSTILRPVNTKAGATQLNREQASHNVTQRPPNHSQTTYTAKISTDTPTAAITKLALTSEAMPALLAKVTEVKMHCSACVTELRNVTV